MLLLFFLLCIAYSEGDFFNYTLKLGPLAKCLLDLEGKPSSIGSVMVVSVLNLI